MNQDQITRLLQDVVRIPSVNPSGDTGTSARNSGEARIAEYLAEYLRKLGLDVETKEVEPGRPNVIGKFSSRGGKRSLAFAPHTDTVSVVGMTIDPFGGEIKDGRLYGRGASDTKGSLTSMLAAVTNVIRDKKFREGDLDIYFTALMGEESGVAGARALMESGFKVDFAIAGEPTDCRVVHTHKGAYWFKVITRGRSVHGSMPDKGESAIKKMAGVIDYILGDYTASLRFKKHPILDSPTVNIGVIRGGSQTNIVPNYCEIEIDRRTLPDETHDQIPIELRDNLRAFGAETELIRDCPPLETGLDNSFLEQLGAATGHGSAAYIGAPWFCDAGTFSQFGVPAVAFGPGNVAQAHTADEFIELREVWRCAGLIENFLRRVAS